MSETCTVYHIACLLVRIKNLAWEGELKNGRPLEKTIYPLTRMTKTIASRRPFTINYFSLNPPQSKINRCHLKLFDPKNKQKSSHFFVHQNLITRCRSYKSVRTEGRGDCDFFSISVIESILKSLQR